MPESVTEIGNVKYYFSMNWIIKNEGIHEIKEYESSLQKKIAQTYDTSYNTSYYKKTVLMAWQKWVMSKN